MHLKKVIGGVGGVVVAVAISFIPAAEPLSRQSMIALGCLVGAVIWMLTDFLPDYLATCSMCVAWVISGAVPLKTAFSTFSSSTWWLLLGALVIGCAASETGLLKRMALKMMGLFPINFHGQVAGLIVSGVVISPLIPSTAVKAAIAAPLAQNISESMGYEPSSKGASGIFAAFYTGYVTAGHCFLSASFISYSLIALMPAGKSVSWFDWFLWASPWLVVALGIMMAGIFLMYKPKESKPLDKRYISDQYKALGAWSKQEKITAVVLLACLLLWVGEKTLGIPSAMVAMAAAMIVSGLGIVDRKMFRTKIAWDSLIFIGTFLCISDVFSSLGINEFIQLVLADKLAPIMSNIWILVPVLCVLVYLIRFAIVSWTASAVLISTLMIPLCSASGIHPFIIIFISYVCANTWMVVYNNTPYIAAFVATDMKLSTHKEMFPYTFVIMAASVVGLLVCIPFWKLFGLC